MKGNSFSKISSSVKGAPAAIRSNWNTTAPGEYMTLREKVYYTLGAMGMNGFLYVTTLLYFANGYFAGSVMGISPQEFYIVSVISTIYSYVFMFMNPISVLIFENHGHIEKKTARFAMTFWILQTAAGIGCYFIPSAPFEGIIKGFPQIIANFLVYSGSTSLLEWFIRYKFSAKYGRRKPFYVVYVLPMLILTCAIPYVPTNAPHTLKLVLLHLLTLFLGYFQAQYIDYQGIVPLLSPNSHERQKLLSYCAIPIGIISSIYSTFTPMLVRTTGGYLNINTYRVFVPILAIISVAFGFFIIPVKERVIENPQKRVKVKFFKAAKQVVKNKYLWIINISGIFGQWSGLFGGIMNFFFIYSIRQEWLMGLAAGAISLVTSNIPKLLVPSIINKYEKRNTMFFCRAFSIIFVACYVIAIKMQNVWLLILFHALRNCFDQVFNQINLGLRADVLDYHQWKYGERADSSSGVFSWFINPISIAVGSIVPAVLATQGYTSNWDVLFDQQIFSNIMIIYVIFSVVGIVLSMAPFLFYDLTREKHQRCIYEMEQRVKSDMESQENENNEETQNDTAKGAEN